ncbi:UDP-glucose 4-epimerase [Streptomyces griseochromogenes]|uniref:UDP-glucose 4-epimerase n=1 Tax=Streptomyces griseochromogenes TaxID=68214 RepID=A0A1B1B253_9ACTN|nr:UDP-glucose 4-epimerase GalE [Streptomyces griseochromogenes]ANP52906.1 UDP-glucose 4-epimerase GalE [Streptomyces griseochromogenes]MBP2047541.1 UDP-glucose 4-epimerase [Streptomyces griseochromogenes]
MPETVLVTGGAGFIGSHTCVELLDHGYEVVVVDNHVNSSPEALDRIAKIAGRPLAAAHRVDVRDRRAMSEVFASHPVDAVIHFAAHKAVGESVARPVEYYDTNVGGTCALLSVMHEYQVDRLVFSSSCSVYGDARTVPLTERSPVAPTNPYARTKLMCERILEDVCARLPRMKVLALRYFNPVGAHPSGLLGEDPRGVPGNLMPYVAQVAVGRRERLSVFGDDYPTPDGTGVRDYIHVVDVAEGHRVALEHLDDRAGMRVFNLGTGTGTSVLELVGAFAEVSGRPVPHRVVDRRPGDVAALVADASAVAEAWDWTTTRDLTAMCRDAWRFQELNPDGYSRRPRHVGGPTTGESPCG